MTVMTIAPSSREDWLTLRQNYIGASEVAALHGVGYLTPYKLWHRKKETLPPDPDTKQKRRGRRREILGLEWLAEDRPDLIISDNAIPGGIYFIDEDTRTAATPDGFAIDDKFPSKATIQIKDVPSYIFKTQWHADGEFEPPLHVAIQANHEACMAGAGYALIVALVCNDEEAEVYPFELPLQPRLFEKSKALIAEFWRRIEANEPYEPDFGRDAAVVKDVYAEAAKDSTLDLSGNNRLAELISLRETLSVREHNGVEAAKERKPIDAEIIHMLGNAEAAIAPGGRLIEAKTVRRKGYEVAASTYRAVKIKAATVELSPKRLGWLI